MSVSVCLSVSPQGYLWNFKSDLNHILCMFPLAMYSSVVL